MASEYPPCEHTKRLTPDVQVTQDIAEAIGRDYRTLPVFEKGIHEYTYKKHYSLQGNQYLQCRWTEYKKHIEDRVFAPFQFLDIRDYHFVNCRNRLQPSESIFRKTNFCMRLKPGPGVDFRGQMPIPQDLMMKRGGKPKIRELSKEKKTVENEANVPRDSSGPEE